LDAELKSFIVADLRAWNAEQKIPIVYVTHTREEVEALGERVIVLDRGRVVSQGYPHAVLGAPRSRKLAQALGFENLFGGTVLDLSQVDGVMRVRLEESTTEIEVPLGYAAPGDPVKNCEFAREISCSRAIGRTAQRRNVLEGNIGALEQRGTTVIALVGQEVTFTVHVTAQCSAQPCADCRQACLDRA